MGNAAQPILLVEDNDDHAELAARAFRKARILNELVRVPDGERALDYLLGRNEYAARSEAALPAIVLLDLNLPGLSGISVLQEIRGAPAIMHTPVVVLTSSDEEGDRRAAYAQFVNSYVRKPVQYDALVAALREIGAYWLVLNQPAPPPPRPRPPR